MYNSTNIKKGGGSSKKNNKGFLIKKFKIKGREEMKKIYLIAFLSLTFIMLNSSCTSVRTNKIGVPLGTHMAVEIKPNITIAKEQVIGEATEKAVFGIFAWGVSKTAEGFTYNAEPVISLDVAANKAKAGAVYNACKKAKADILISPQYLIETKNYVIYKVVKCKVIGYPATLNSVEVKK